jgi:branched-chain amino acid transport system ATP-binding protein
MPGDRKVFETLTVEEHIRLTHRLDSFDEAMQETRETFPPLARLVKAPAGNLSGGERQMLALACAFAARPSLVLIDELSQGLSPAAANRAMAAAMELRDRLGVAVLLVEQMVGLGFAVADEVIVMDGGEFVRQGEADESFKDWTEAYLLGGVVK